ncbi:TPA: hypothetical protein DF272_04125 [Candidatus Falkowbacteria bacterium]|nr:hypothetical protein [Candidatus Falkowbacteria bacterium]
MSRCLLVIGILVSLGFIGCFAECRDSFDCPDKMVCDLDIGQCYVPNKCFKDSNCPSDFYCADDEHCYPSDNYHVDPAGCYDDNDCLSEMYCATDRMCYRIDNWKPACFDDRDCPWPVFHMYCDKARGRCYPNQQCANDDGCPPGMFCDRGSGRFGKCDYY